MGKFISRLFIVTIIFGVIAVITGCVTGEIRYIETYSVPGESRGYIGRRAHHLDSKEHLIAVFDELANLPEFEGEEIILMSLNVSEEMINADIQLPENREYVDSYRYNPQNFQPKWENVGSAKGYELSKEVEVGYVDDAISLQDLQVERIYYLYEDMLAYIEETGFEREEDSPMSISLLLDVIYLEENMLSYEPARLIGQVTGVRDDLSFSVNLDDQQYEMIVD
ncbi:hypothetical protein APT62_00860 [Aerococcus urinaeequi]|uniref:hypothetical protein n=1 Tax=Aerococcus urinaeequi TaxID=51665 RepID=UPI000744C4F4|nr:hypothetical protein [Aerococcus urinaeequi]ALZ87086.1 hypothetical protein APT62_00860 [Aerococcus urinaeequi]